jgi:L,D-transpeptidase catalytic domain
VKVFPALAVALSVAFGADALAESRAKERGSPVSAEKSRRVEWRATDLAGLTVEIFDLALDAAECAERAGEVRDVPTLTVIDYSRPSTEKRLWVFDLRGRKLLHRELVAHGEGSGEHLATRFSNEQDSHQSSLGLFVTGDTYVGQNGYSMRMTGLDKGVNDRALERAIVMHGAPYVSAGFANTHGRLGRSWGCPALDEAVARRIIDRVKGGGLVFAYYPDRDWLATSKYLGECAAAAEKTSEVILPAPPPAK